MGFYRCEYPCINITDQKLVTDSCFPTILTLTDIIIVGREERTGTVA